MTGPATVLRLPRALAERGGHVARPDDLARLAGALDSVVDGAARAVFVGGEPGMGKTWLAAALAQAAHERGATVLFGRFDDDTGLPYQGFMEALQPLVSSMVPGALARLAGAGELVRLLPGADRLVGDKRPLRADAEAERWALFEAVAELLGTVATPVVLVLDDLQWAARPAVLLVRHLLRSSPPRRFLLVATYRHTEIGRRHPLSEILAELRRDDIADRLLLTGLGEDGVAGMVRAHGPNEVDVANLRDVTGGNPFFIEEVLRHLDETGRTAAASAELPESIRDVVSRRLGRLAPSTIHALTVAAVLGPSFAFRHLEAVPEAHAGGADVLDAIDEAIASGLLVESGDTVAFAHDLVRQTILGELSASRRMRLHRRIAEALETLPERNELVDLLAHHFAECALDGQAHKAGTYALEAGLRAIGTAAHEHAAALLQRGLDALELAGVDDPALRTDLSVLAASAMAASDGWGYDLVVTLLERGLDDALATGVPERIVAAAEVRADHLRVSEGDEAMAAALAGLLDRASTLTPVTRARLLAAEAYRRADLGLTGASDLVDAAVDAATGTSTDALHRALRARMATLFAQPRPDDLLALADELEAAGEPDRNVHHWVTTLAARAGASLVLADLAGFDAATARIEEIGARTRAAQARFYTVCHRATRAGIDGRWDDMAAHTSAILEFAADKDALSIWAALEYRRHWDLGRLAEFLPAVEVAVWTTPTVAALRGALCLARSFVDADGARDLLHELVDGLPAIARDRTWPATLQVLGESAARLGDEQAALALYGEIRPFEELLLVPGGGAFVAGIADEVLASLARTGGRLEEALAHGRRAVALAEQLPSPPFLARALLATGRAQLAAGDPGGLATTGAAASLAARLGMGGVAADARAAATA